MTALSDSNFDPMGLSEYSLTFGEAISKVGRHKLCRLCLREIEEQARSSESDSPKGRRRGRPQSSATVLAIRVGVSYDTIMRWQNPKAIQSCDANAVKLARLALIYNREETVKILRHDLERHREAIESWVRRMDPVVENFPNGDKGQTQNIVASPCVENTEVEEAF